MISNIVLFSCGIASGLLIKWLLYIIWDLLFSDPRKSSRRHQLYLRQRDILNKSRFIHIFKNGAIFPRNLVDSYLLYRIEPLGDGQEISNIYEMPFYHIVVDTYEEQRVLTEILYERFLEIKEDEN